MGKDRSVDTASVSTPASGCAARMSEIAACQDAGMSRNPARDMARSAVIRASALALEFDERVGQRVLEDAVVVRFRQRFHQRFPCPVIANTSQRFGSRSPDMRRSFLNRSRAMLLKEGDELRHRVAIAP